jgi:hypothetical protein
MHLGVALSEAAGRVRADEVGANEPLAMDSPAALLCRNIRVCEFDAIAMARWGYSRMRIWLDFSGDGGCPSHKVDDGGL